MRGAPAKLVFHFVTRMLFKFHPTCHHNSRHLLSTAPIKNPPSHLTQVPQSHTAHSKKIPFTKDPPDWLGLELRRVPKFLLPFFLPLSPSISSFPFPRQLAQLIVNAGGVGALVDYVASTRGPARLPGIMTLARAPPWPRSFGFVSKSFSNIRFFSPRGNCFFTVR